MRERRLKIALFGPSLGLGGAERQLANLAIGLHRRGHAVSVLVLYGGEPMERGLLEKGIPVVNLDKPRAAVGAIPAFIRLRRYLRRHPLDILYSFHGLPNLLTPLACACARRTACAIGVRATQLDASHMPWLQRAAYWLEARLASQADVVIANSHAGCRDAKRRGFPATRLRVVPNGIDTDAFSPDPEAGLAFRRELGIAAGVPLIGMVARIDPMKDYATFLAAAIYVRASEPGARFLCVWDGDTAEQQRLAESELSRTLSDALIWARGNSNLCAIYNALDVLVSSSSYGEGFPNVVGEAMACGGSCVVTDVGDAARLVDGLGIVVPPRDPVRLAAGIRQALASQSGIVPVPMARERIVSTYSLDAMVENSLQVLLPLVSTNLAAPQLEN